MTDKLSKGMILPTKIVVKEQKQEEKVSPAGLVIIAPKKNPQTFGKVLLTGSGTPNLPMIVKEGMTVLYTPLSGQRFLLNDEEFTLVDQANILFMFNE